MQAHKLFGLALQQTQARSQKDAMPDVVGVQLFHRPREVGAEGIDGDAHLIRALMVSASVRDIRTLLLLGYDTLQLFDCGFGGPA